jgi:hypothetical protein
MITHTGGADPSDDSDESEKPAGKQFEGLGENIAARYTLFVGCAKPSTEPSLSGPNYRRVGLV